MSAPRSSHCYAAQDDEAKKIFEACAKVALCNPYRLTDPLGVYAQFEFADQSKRMHARIYRVWLSKVSEYPWHLDRKSIQAFVDEHYPPENIEREK